MLHFIAWYFVIALIGWLVFPISFRLLKFLPERGLAILRPLGLLLWGYLYWLLASLGVFGNNTGSAAFTLFLVLGLSIWAAWGKWPDMRAWLKENRRTVVAIEAVFLVSFALWAFVRAANPEILNTEKPMELAFINSILRSATFPPADPWLSGYAISYYYFGYVMISLLVRLTGTPTLVAFNLGIALWFAMTAAAAYGVVYNLLSGYYRARRTDETDGRRKALSWAVLAPVFILLLGNMSGLLELLHSGGVGWSKQPDGTYSSSFWSWLDITSLNQAPPEPFNWQPHRGSWSWWAGSRVLKDYDLNGNSQEIIDEFPQFSYLLADMHPHVLAMPFALLAVMLALNLFYKGSQTKISGLDPLNWLKAPENWLTMLALGGMSFLNTWDFPIYVGLFAAVYAFLRFRQLGWSCARIKEFLGMGILLGLAGYALYYPFYTGFASQAGGLLPSGVFYTRGAQFWVMFATFLVPLLLWLAHALRSTPLKGTLWRGFKFAAAVIFGLWLLMIVALLLVNVAQVAGQNLAVSANTGLAQFGAKINQYAGELFNKQGGSAGEIITNSFAKRLLNPGAWLTMLLMLTATWGLLARPQTEGSGSDLPLSVETKIHPQPFVLILVLLGLGLAIFPEYFYLLDGFGWRMNTIFKFYFQTWVLWGLASAFAFAVLWEELRGTRAMFAKIALTFTVAAASLYCLIMLPAKIHEAQPENNLLSLNLTLDGRSNFYTDDDMASFAWLQSAPYGVVLEATGGQYQPNYARAGTFSGQPTVLGWAGHEGQWRGGYTEVGSRDQDIRTMYESPDWAETKALLERYHVRYIYIANSERTTYSVSETKFMANLPVAYYNNTVVIYAVPDYTELGQLNGN
jgi:YYY domain-containing protein